LCTPERIVERNGMVKIEGTVVDDEEDEAGVEPIVEKNPQVLDVKGGG
jgi:hypothetical protein